MFPAAPLLARIHLFGLGPAESVIVLVLLLVLVSGYALPEDRPHGGRLTRKELYVISTAAALLAAAVAVIVWQSFGN